MLSYTKKLRQGRKRKRETSVNFHDETPRDGERERKDRKRKMTMEKSCVRVTTL